MAGTGTAPLIIRKGQALATLRQIKTEDIKHGLVASVNVDIEEAKPAEAQSRELAETHRQQQTQAEATAVSKAKEKEEEEAARLIEKADIWKIIGKRTCRQIVAWVQAGHQIGNISLQQ